MANTRKDNPDVTSQEITTVSATGGAMVSLNDIATMITSLTSMNIRFLVQSGVDLAKVADCACQGRNCGCDGVYCRCDTVRGEPGDIVSFPEYVGMREAAIKRLQAQLSALQITDDQKKTLG